MKNLTCRYCGKTQLNLENLSFKTNKEAEEYATLNCDCLEGEEYRNMKVSEKNLNNFLDLTSYNDEIKSFLKSCGLHILSFKDVVINYQFGNVKIKFSIKKGKLKIEILTTDKTEELI